MLDMDPQVREAWVKALRSGEYPQATKYLHVEGKGFCCLGVLCDLAVKDGAIPAPVSMRRGDIRVWVYGNHDDAAEASFTSLPYAVCDWAGLSLDNTDPIIAMRETDEDGNDAGTGFHPASDLNDNLHLTFAEIADAIAEDVDS